MNYAQIRQFDIANGVGVRTTLFVSGCHFNCNGCFNHEYQDFSYGKPFTQDTMDEIIMYLSNPVVRGFSLLGGEPFDQSENAIYQLCKEIKEKTQKSIWVWSGYKFEYLTQHYQDILKYIDVLVDGQFEIGLKDLRLLFRGSANQRLIDVQKSLQLNDIVLLDQESIRKM